MLLFLVILKDHFWNKVDTKHEGNFKNEDFPKIKDDLIVTVTGIVTFSVRVAVTVFFPVTAAITWRYVTDK